MGIGGIGLNDHGCFQNQSKSLVVGNSPTKDLVCKRSSTAFNELSTFFNGNRLSQKSSLSGGNSKCSEECDVTEFAPEGMTSTTESAVDENEGENNFATSLDNLDTL